MRGKTSKTPDTPSKLPTFDSMAACEGATGIPKHVLQAAKKKGCAAFDSHSRVNLEQFLRWFFANVDDSEGEDWGTRWKRAQALNAEMELEERKGQLVEIDKVHEQQQACASKAAAILRAKFVVELPPKQEGAPAERIAEMNAREINAVFEALAKPETYAS